jgi:hypothetical protein
LLKGSTGSLLTKSTGDDEAGTSLNFSVRKKQLEVINEENRKIFDRLTAVKPQISTIDIINDSLQVRIDGH